MRLFPRFLGSTLRTPEHGVPFGSSPLCEVADPVGRGEGDRFNDTHGNSGTSMPNSRSRSLLFSLTLTVGALALLPLGAAFAERPDAMMPVKGTLATGVDVADDVTTIGFLMTESEATKFSLLVKPAKKSDLELDVRLIAPDDTAFDPKLVGKVRSKSNLFKAKFKFQNPIFQNLRHVRAVQDLIDFLPPGAIKSVVVFTGDAEFKTEIPQGVFSLSGLTEYFREQTAEVMSLNRVQFCVGRLETARLAISGQTDVEHVQSLERRHGSSI
jgi:hypothetical protein